jgi:hypothetical protein
MTFLLLFVGGFVAAIVLPMLFSPSHADRNRLMSLSIAGYMILLGVAFIAVVIYHSIVFGETGIGARGTGAMVSFTDEPAVATIVLLVNLAIACTFVAMGWVTIRYVNRSNATQGNNIDLSTLFTDTEIAAAKEEAKRNIDKSFPGLGNIKSAYYDALLQGEIDKILRK